MSESEIDDLRTAIESVDPRGVLAGFARAALSLFDSERAKVKALREALRMLVPPDRVPSENCWCPHYHDRAKAGHARACAATRAAFAATSDPIEAPGDEAAP